MCMQCCFIRVDNKILLRLFHMKCNYYASSLELHYWPIDFVSINMEATIIIFYLFLY